MLNTNDDYMEIITSIKNKLEASIRTISTLTKENQDLRHENARLRAHVGSFRSQDSEIKSTLCSKVQNSINSEDMEASHQIPTPRIKNPQKQEVDNTVRIIRVPRPPPMSISSPTTPSPRVDRKHISSAPPPPPFPSKLLPGSRAVQRVPEVIEFYRSLTKRDTRTDSKTDPSAIQAAQFSKTMIGEIENRSTYLTAIKSDVEKKGELINFIAAEVASAAHTEISEVEAFVKWLDEELSYLVDERAVLKHFKQWPERKADALREAAFSYRDLKNLESEATSFGDNTKDSLRVSIKKMQALQERLEQCVDNTERSRESTSKRYKEFQIPWEWMLETGIIGQLKLSSVRLAREYMKRVVRELTVNEHSPESDLRIQAVRFAYRVHQFAGGFDINTTKAFEELKRVLTNCHNQQSKTCI